MSSPSISKIHVTNSTGVSLNERFTEQARQVPAVRSRSRSRSRSRAAPPKVDRATSLANARLLRQLAKKHTMQAALKLKRRSMKTAGAGAVLKRSSVKTVRIGPNGRPISANTLARIATMKADLMANGKANGRATLRRPLNRASTLPAGRRPMVGGAAERIAQRVLKRLRTSSAIRMGASSAAAGVPRGVAARSRSRIRAPVVAAAAPLRGRSRSRSRAPRLLAGAKTVAAAAALPIQARLGIRPGQQMAKVPIANRSRGGKSSRALSFASRGVATGRIQKSRVTAAVAGGGRRSQLQLAGGASDRLARSRGRSVPQNTLARAQTGGRKVSFSFKQQQQQQQQGQQQQKKKKQQQSGQIQKQSNQGAVAPGQGRRGRKPPQQQQVQQRNGRPQGAKQRTGGPSKQQQQQQRQPIRRGQAPGRGGRGGGRKLGKNQRPEVKKEDLDKELDQYMATTKTENDMDYLLRR